MNALSRTSVVLGLVLSLAGPAEAAAPGWDHAGYDAEDSFYNPGESVINAGTVGRLAPRWSVALRRDEGACGGPSAPLVAGGSVVATDERGIASYRASTGRLAWRFDWDDPDDSSTPSMAVAGRLLVAANGDCQSASDPDGRIVAIDLLTGRVRWRVASPMPIASFVVDKGVVVVSGRSPSDELTTVAYRATDGLVRWHKPGFEATGVSANGVLLLTHGRSTSAVSVVSGAPLWTRPAVWQAETASPSGDRFFVTNATALSAVRASDGAVLWTTADRTPGLIANDGRRVYLAAERTIEALDATTGRRLWSRQLVGPSVQPVRAGGLLYTGGPVLSAATGAVVTPGVALRGTQVIAGGRLFSVRGHRLTSFAP